MKAISLWQPWASAVAIGSKRIETRSWATAYRGPLAIQAAKRLRKCEIIHLSCVWGWQGAMRAAGWSWGKDTARPWDVLPFGAIVATCDLVDCRPTGSFTQDEIHARRRPDGDIGGRYAWTEALLGDFSPGRFGWVLANVRPLAAPIPAVGRQGFFEWEPPAALTGGAPDYPSGFRKDIVGPYP